MRPIINLIGQKFGRLIVVANKKVDKGCPTKWICKCKCGALVTVKGKSLKRGDTKSCGCLVKDTNIKINTTHGMTGSPEYRIWCLIIQRCTNLNSFSYEYYGGRGIKVCKRWLKFENFFKDMGLRPNKLLTIDRTDNNKGYYKKNCCWATRTEQSHNTRIFKKNKTGVKGVFWDKESNRYRVSIGINNKRICLGSFINLDDAANARKDGEIKHW